MDVQLKIWNKRVKDKYLSILKEILKEKEKERKREKRKIRGKYLSDICRLPAHVWSGDDHERRALAVHRPVVGDEWCARGLLHTRVASAHHLHHPPAELGDHPPPPTHPRGLRKAGRGTGEKRR